LTRLLSKVVIVFSAKIERAFLQISSRYVYVVPLTRGEG